MAQNITLLGANYPNVPAVQLPKTGGGMATFYDIQSKTYPNIIPEANQYVAPFTHCAVIPYDNDVNYDNFIAGKFTTTASGVVVATSYGIYYCCNNTAKTSVTVIYYG